MKCRWIIRSFNIALLTLCVAGWLLSYEYGRNIVWGSRIRWGVVWQSGEIYLACISGFAGSSWGGIDYSANRAEWFADWGLRYWFGFSVRIENDFKMIAVPFWLPTTLSAILLWIGWRKARPKTSGRAFPVEQHVVNPQQNQFTRGV